jgi:Phage tail lysozyme
MAEASPADASGGPHPAPYDARTEIFNGLIKRGLTPQQAMGSVYGLMGESGTALNPNANGDSGKSFGMGQWNGARKANLDSTAAGMNTTWNDPRAQVAHLFNELDGPYSKVLANIKANANTAADATNIWTGQYESPKVNNWQQRYVQGSQAGRLDADGNPTWTTGPAAPLPAASSVPQQGPQRPGAAAPAADTRSPAQKFSDAAKKGDVGGALGALAEGTKGSGLADAAKTAAPAPASTPMLQSEGGDSQGQQAAAGQALLGQVLTQASKPLTWASRPYGAGTAGPQVPGTTLNSVGYQ